MGNMNQIRMQNPNMGPMGVPQIPQDPGPGPMGVAQISQDLGNMSMAGPNQQMNSNIQSKAGMMGNMGQNVGSIAQTMVPNAMGTGITSMSPSTGRDKPDAINYLFALLDYNYSCRF